MANETLEELFKGLDEIVSTMEETDISLEESFKLYHRGMELLKSCNDRLDKIEKKMQILDDKGEVHEFGE